MSTLFVSPADGSPRLDTTAFAASRVVLINGHTELPDGTGFERRCLLFNGSADGIAAEIWNGCDSFPQPDQEWDLVGSGGGSRVNGPAIPTTPGTSGPSYPAEAAGFGS